MLIDIGTVSLSSTLLATITMAASAVIHKQIAAIIVYN